MIRKFCLITSLSTALLGFTQDACRRTALINNQEILVDTSSINKGSGLKPYLDKDAEAKNYLNAYQKTRLSRNQNAVIGTLGLGVMLSGVALAKKHPLEKRSLLTLGVSLLIANFLVAQAIRLKNESLLAKSIREYNKRNYPKIYFVPDSSQLSPFHQKGTEFGLMAELQISF